MIHGAEVIVKTDHRPLSFVKAGSEHNRKLARWWAELQNYNIRVDYVEGKKNVVADALSRLTTAQDEESFHFAMKRVYEDEDGDEVVDCNKCGDTYFSRRVR